MEAKIMMDALGDAKGEGMAFVVQTAGADALGAGGNGKGYGGIVHSIAVDISTNTESPGTKISITEGDPANVLLGSAQLGDIVDLKIRTLRVEYDALTNTLVVAFDGQMVLRGNIDLVSKLQSNAATWGFTAATGVSQSSDQWVYFQKFENGEISHYQPPPPSVYLSENFNAPATNFVFHSNLFGEASDPSYITHEADPTRFGKWHNKHSSGGLRLTFFGANNNEVISGGWETTLALTEDVQSATMEVKYRAEMLEGFETADGGQVVVRVAGDLHIVETLHGGNAQIPLWGKATVQLGSLSEGTHQIQIGGILSTNGPTSNDKTFQIRFDELSVKGVPGIA